LPIITTQCISKVESRLDMSGSSSSGKNDTHASHRLGAFGRAIARALTLTVGQSTPGIWLLSSKCDEQPEGRHGW